MQRVLEGLDREFEQLAGSDEARAAVRRWGEAHPALAGAATVGDVLARRRDAKEARGVLRALAELAGDDWLAARVLLQALLPGLICLARRAASDDPAAIEEVVALAWERIRTYPLTRAGSVAANVLWDVRKRYRRHREVDVPSGAHLEPAPAPAPEAPSPEDVVVQRSVFEELAAARRDGDVNDTALRILVRTRVHGEPLSAVASEENLTVRAGNQRRWRAEQRLRPRLSLVS